MSLEVSAEPVFQPGAPKALFQVPPVANTSWDVAPDGQRFLFPVLAANARVPFTVVMNWQTVLTR